jgi:hypothetical protein
VRVPAAHAARVIRRVGGLKHIPGLVAAERIIVVRAHGAGVGRVIGRRRRTRPGPGGVRVGVIRPRTAAAAAAAAAAVLGGRVVRIVLVVHVDGRVRLLVVRREGEGGLVRVDVLVAGRPGAVVARQAVVPLVVFERPDADEGGGAEEETGCCC